MLDRFLNTDYAACLYNTERTPTLELATGEKVLPREAIWYYRFDGNLVGQKNIIPMTSEKCLYAVSGTVDLALTPEPTECTVVITGESGKIFFTGTLEELSKGKYDIPETLHVEMRSTWAPS